MKKSLLSMSVLGLLMVSAFTVYADIPGRNPNISDTAWQNYGIATTSDKERAQQNFEKVKNKINNLIPNKFIENLIENRPELIKNSVVVVQNTDNLDYRVMIPGTLITYSVDVDKDKHISRQLETKEPIYHEASIITTNGLYSITSEPLAQKKTLQDFLTVPYEHLTDQQIKKSIQKSLIVQKHQLVKEGKNEFKSLPNGEDENEKKRLHNSVETLMSAEENTVQAGKLSKSDPNALYTTWDITRMKNYRENKDIKNDSKNTVNNLIVTTGNLYWANKPNMYYIIGNYEFYPKHKILPDTDNIGAEGLANYVLPSFRPASDAVKNAIKDTVVFNDKTYYSDISSFKFYKPEKFQGVKGKNFQDELEKGKQYRLSKQEGIIVSTMRINKMVDYKTFSSIWREFYYSLKSKKYNVTRVENFVSNDVPGVLFEFIDTAGNYQTVACYFPIGTNCVVRFYYYHRDPISDADSLAIRDLLETGEIEIIPYGQEENSKGQIVDNSEIITDVLKRVK